MGKHLTRRVAALERRAAPRAAPAPCFVLAEDAAAAAREVARIRAAHPDGCPTLFVMTRGRQEPEQPTTRGA
jgi:hypothetical protein